MRRDVLHNARLFKTRTSLSGRSSDYALHRASLGQSPMDTHTPTLTHSPKYDYELLDHELEMDIEASDNTARRQEEAAMRVSEHQNPFSSSKLQPFHQMSEVAVDSTMRLYCARAEREKQFLNARQAANLRGKSVKSMKLSMFDQRHNSNDSQWKLVKEQADVRVFRNVQRRGKTTTMMAQGLLRGSLGEIMDGLYAETTKEARVLYALLSDTFLDASVLHVDSYRTAQHPFQFAGVTWMAMETPRGCGVCKDRDFLCFKKMGTFKDPETGDDVGYLTLLSVDQNDHTSVQWLAPPSSDLVRGFLSLTAFFKTLPSGATSLFIQGDFNARGHLASRLADNMFADLVFAIANAPSCGQAKSLAMLLQSISTGQRPGFGCTSSTVSTTSQGHVPQLLPLLSERNRDRCGVCSKTLWKVLESPEYCRGCWTRTCRKCHVTLPIYCADFHRAHDEDQHAHSHFPSWPGGNKHRRLAKPCKETFCLKCVCSVLPTGVKMNARLLKQAAKKKRRARKVKGSSSNGSVSTRSVARRGGAAATSNSPSVVMSVASRSKYSGSSAGSSSRQRGKVYVQLPRSHHHVHRSRTGASHRDDQSSISVHSSVDSMQLQRHHLGLATTAPASRSVAQRSTSRPQTMMQSTCREKPPLLKSHSQPASMLEVLENFQLSQMATTMSTDLLSDDSSLPLTDRRNGATAYSSFTSSSPAGAADTEHGMSMPEDSMTTTRKLQLRVNLTPRKRTRRSMASSSNSSYASSTKNGSSADSSRRTNAASSSTQSPYNDEYYHKMLQQYLDKRRTSLGVASTSTMSTDNNQDASTEGKAAAATTSSSSNSGSAAYSRSTRLPRSVFKDFQPPPIFTSFQFDHPQTPSRLSFSSLSSSVTSSQAAEAIAAKYSTTSKGGWAPPAF